ncbi:MAG: methanogenesis marker 17 protein [Methanomassiliicoccaceae archaeon]|nr:methanogenesis marker 17 protein [Methanomassiliicoccaceae archaeon]
MMEVNVTGPEEYGNKAYRTLFENVMNELGSSVSIEKAELYMDPVTPLFILSVVMRSRPESKKISDTASIRTEGNDVHITISDENYAHEIFSALERIYGRNSVDQQTRFDLKIENGDDDLIANTEIASEEDAKKEMIGAMWRVLPEGIKARHNISEGRIITIAATEEIVTDHIKSEAMRIHNGTKGDADV